METFLLKDLCARLPYGVKCAPVTTTGEINTIGGYCEVLDSVFIKEIDGWFSISMIKPYLRPMESMTDAEREEWFKQSRVEYDCEFHPEPTLSLCNCHLSTDWLNKRMFDYRGLIRMGLALEATEDMYNKMEE